MKMINAFRNRILKMYGSCFYGADTEPFIHSSQRYYPLSTRILSRNQYTEILKSYSIKNKIDLFKVILNERSHLSRKNNACVYLWCDWKAIFLGPIDNPVFVRFYILNKSASFFDKSGITICIPETLILSKQLSNEQFGMFTFSESFWLYKNASGMPTPSSVNNVLSSSARFADSVGLSNCDSSFVGEIRYDYAFIQSCLPSLTLVDLLGLVRTKLPPTFNRSCLGKIALGFLLSCGLYYSTLAGYYFISNAMLENSIEELQEQVKNYVKLDDNVKELSKKIDGVGYFYDKYPKVSEMLSALGDAKESVAITITALKISGSVVELSASAENTVQWLQSLNNSGCWRDIKFNGATQQAVGSRVENFSMTMIYAPDGDCHAK